MSSSRPRTLGAADAPAAVVFVVSAVAPLTESDCALVDLATQHTDLVIGVVSKIDVHRDWRDVLAADRSRLAAHAERYQRCPVGGCRRRRRIWANPTSTSSSICCGQRLDDPDVKRRNRLRAWEVPHCDRDRAASTRTAGRRPAGTGDRAAENDATTVLRERRLAKSERTIALRSQIQQARVQLDVLRAQPLHLGAMPSCRRTRHP